MTGPSPTADFTWRVLGNPVGEQLMLEISSEKNLETTCRIVDMNGRLRWNQPLSGTAGKSVHSFAVGELPAGGYLLLVGNKAVRLVAFFKN